MVVLTNQFLRCIRRKSIISCVISPFFIVFQLARVALAGCRLRLFKTRISKVEISKYSKSNLLGYSGEYNASRKKPAVKTFYRVVFAEKYYGHVLLIKHFDWTIYIDWIYGH